MKQKYPELISLNLFGSMVKGYANVRSDIDAILFISNDIPLNYDGSYGNLVLSHLNNVGLKEIFISLDLGVEFVSSQSVKEGIGHRSSKEVMSLFLIAVGDDVKKYRKIVLEELENMELQGERAWIGIMEQLWDFENIGLSEELRQQRRALYPWTIEEGKKYFLKGM